MKTSRVNSLIRNHWLKIIISFMTIGAVIWAYTGYTNLTNAFDLLKTPVNVILPTSKIIISYPTETENPPANSEMMISTPSPGDIAPKVPNSYQDYLGKTLYPVLIEDQGWYLTDLNGKQYYSWVGESSQWIALKEVKNGYCNIPLLSKKANEPWNSVCYMALSGLGIPQEEGTQFSGTITKDVWGKVQIIEQDSVLYELVMDPLEGYQWVETVQGYIKRISEATQLISNIVPQTQLSEVEIPNYIVREYYSTENSLTARYIGGVDHEIFDEGGKELGSVKLHLFARSKDVLFWISGEGQVLGIKTGLPFFTRYYQLGIDRVDFLLDSSEALIPNNRYEFVYFGVPNIKPTSDENQIDLSQADELDFISFIYDYPDLWKTKQLLLIMHTNHHQLDYFEVFSGELETSPPSLMSYYYLKVP